MNLALPNKVSKVLGSQRRTGLYCWVLLSVALHLVFNEMVTL